MNRRDMGSGGSKGGGATKPAAQESQSSNSQQQEISAAGQKFAQEREGSDFVEAVVAKTTDLADGEYVNVFLSCS